MTTDLMTRVREELQIERPDRKRYTREAYQLVPSLVGPCILDVGCGAGMPTLELARLSGGEIVGIDIDQTSLGKFTARMEAAGLSDHVRSVKCSMFHMPFPDASFDIIWSEGSDSVIGFERGLREWRRLLKPRGFVVVHEAVWLQPSPPREIREHWTRVSPGIMSVPDCLEAIHRCGYELIAHYTLPEDTWWTEYFGPAAGSCSGTAREMGPRA